jgi:hypothetical protein
MNWKRLLLISIGWGLGTAIGLSAIVGAYLWYDSRPKPPMPWRTTAISSPSSEDSPAFRSDDNKTIRFTYTVQNSTDYDYEIETGTPIRITVKHTDGSFSEPMPEDVAKMRLPVFIPSRQKGDITFSLFFGDDLPKKKSNESEDQYHERLRIFCKSQLGDDAFTLFDERNRYQINLPKVRFDVTSQGSSLPPCPSNDPLGLSVSKPCQPLPPKK